MEWKPKRWVAVILALISSALSLLYIGKPRWAIGLAPSPQCALPLPA